LRPFPGWHGPEVTIPGFWEHAAPEGAVDLLFSFFPALTFFGMALMSLIGAARMPKHSYFKVQKMGLAAFGGLLGLIALGLLAPPLRDRVQDIFWFVAKVAVFMYMYIWYRGTFPRYRFDQLMKMGWKVLLPAGLAVLIVTAILGVLL
jgi:NADH-quinone oxidoreductase subunit H